MPWLAIKLFLGGALKRLTAAFSALLGWIGRYPWQAALIASLCLSGWLWRGRQAARVEAAQWEQATADEKAGRKSDLAKYQKAQKDAKDLQDAIDRGDFVSKATLAEKARALSELSTERTRIAVADYARRNPVRVCRDSGAVSGAASGTSGPGLPGDPGQPPGEETPADWVAITRPNLDALADQAVQGAVKTEFLNAAVAAGWAVPQSKVPPMAEVFASDRVVEPLLPGK